MSSRESAKQMVRRLVAAYPAQRVGDDTIALWADMLMRVDEHFARLALEEVVRTRTKFPAVAEFYKALDAVRERNAPRGDQRALQRAWCPECHCSGWSQVSSERNAPVRRCARGCPIPRPGEVTPDEPLPHGASADAGRARRDIDE